MVTPGGRWNQGVTGGSALPAMKFFYPTKKRPKKKDALKISWLISLLDWETHLRTGWDSHPLVLTGNKPQPLRRVQSGQSRCSCSSSWRVGTQCSEVDTPQAWWEAWSQILSKLEPNIMKRFMMPFVYLPKLHIPKNWLSWKVKWDIIFCWCRFISKMIRAILPHGSLDHV